MSEVPSSAQAYALGHTPEAFQRLLVQGQLFNPFTRRLIETLAARLREEVASAGGVARLPALVSAWARV